jgi:hypothetical protein
MSDEPTPCQLLSEAVNAAFRHGEAHQRFIDAQQELFDAQQDAEAAIDAAHQAIHPAPAKKDLN